MSDLIAFLNARLDEKKMHAEKDLWCVRRASADWEGHFGHNLPYSELWAGGQVIARFTGTQGLPLADGEDDQHQADLMLAARMGNAAGPRAERVLREVAADRAIIAEYERYDGERGFQNALEFAIVRRAAVYSDHPDYRAEWKP